jgi:hypothetical protein
LREETFLLAAGRVPARCRWCRYGGGSSFVGGGLLFSLLLLALLCWCRKGAKEAFAHTTLVINLIPHTPYVPEVRLPDHVLLGVRILYRCGWRLVLLSSGA